MWTGWPAGGHLVDGAAPGFLRVLVFVARAAIAPVVALATLHPWTALKNLSNAVLVGSATVFREEETPFSTHKQVWGVPLAAFSRQ